jgi:hypothetical protein
MFQKYTFTPLEIISPYSAAAQHYRIIPAGFNTPIEFLTGFTPVISPDYLQTTDRIGTTV